MSSMPYFSCIDCEHHAQASRPNWSKCSHPAVEASQFEGRGLETYTNEDLEKLETLVNDTLKMKVVVVRGVVSNFEFPFEFESTWINGCNGFKLIEKKIPKTWPRGTNK